MKSWLFSVVILFILAKAFLWVKGFILPLPLSVLAGAFLAIASNYDRGMGNLIRLGDKQSDVTVHQTASIVEEIPLIKSQD